MQEMKITKNPTKMNEISFETQERLLMQQRQEDTDMLKNERKSPFTSFYQVNKQHSEDLMWLINKNPNAYKILLFLCDHMDRYNAVMCSYQVLQDYFDMGRTTASNAIKTLKEHGFIHVYKSGTSNVYVANPDLVWNSWGNNRQYCEFPANIILSASEQEERTKLHNQKIQTVIENKNQ